MLRSAISSLIVLILVPASAGALPAVDGIQKIRHVIIIMQENRSFDSYFGTFPGADGIPMRDGVAQALRSRSGKQNVCAALPRHER